MITQKDYLRVLYSNRFSPEQQQSKLVLWKILTHNFLQKHIDIVDSSVLDIGGGYCEFINSVCAKNKFLLDLNPDAKDFADRNVTVLNVDILSESKYDLVPQNYFDIIFVSNFFEHLRNKDELIEVLAFCFNSLKEGGRLLVIQPNFKYSSKEYYDFIDHYLPITDNSLQEVLRAIGFSIELVIPRFLPFSTKGRPSSPFLLKIYLKVPLFWKILGGQMFIKASRPVS
jgi:SAM-dependent methyltransferase